MSIPRTSLRAVALAAVVALCACGDSPFQVIEELTFDPSLGIDLAQMERLASGVYRQDITVGDLMGPSIADGTVPTVSYIGWLADGTQFGQGSFAFIVGAGRVVPGFEEGAFGMRIGGVRLIIIPPELGYGDEDQAAIPPGSVLVFQVTVDDIETDPDDPLPAAVGISR